MTDDQSVGFQSPKDAAAAFVNQRKKDWWTSMQQKRKTWARLDRRYFNYRSDLDISDDTATGAPRANIGVPLAGETIDTAVARSHDNLLGRKPFGRIKGTEGVDDYKADIHQVIADMQMSKPAVTLNLHRIVRDSYKYGTGFFKMHFINKSRSIPKAVTVADLLAMGDTRMLELPGVANLLNMRVGMRKERMTVYQSPFIEHKHIFDVFFPMDAPSLDDAEGIIDRTWQSLQRLRRAVDGLGMPLYDAGALASVRLQKSSKDVDAQIKEEYQTRDIQDGALMRDDKYAVLEYTGRLPRSIAEGLVTEYSEYSDADPDEDWLIATIEGHDKALRCECVPYLTDQRMWGAAKVIDDPGFICGVSLIEAVERLGLTIDELYNMALDNVNFVINKMFYVNDYAGIDDSDLVASPGKAIHGSKVPQDAIQVIEWPDISQSVFVLIQNFIAHYKEYTGIQNPILGQMGKSGQTATEFAGLLTSSQTRLGQFDRMLEETLMRPMFERWVTLNQQFLDDEYLARMLKDTAPQLPRVAPEDMEGVFDYFFEGASHAESQALYVGQIMQAWQINNTSIVPPFDPLMLATELARAWRWKEPGRYLNPMFQQQWYFYQQVNALKTAGETAQALMPPQQVQNKAQKKSGGAAKQGAAAQPANVGVQNYRSALATVKEAALPQGVTEGQRNYT